MRLSYNSDDELETFAGAADIQKLSYKPGITASILLAGYTLQDQALIWRGFGNRCAPRGDERNLLQLPTSNCLTARVYRYRHFQWV